MLDLRKFRAAEEGSTFMELALALPVLLLLVFGGLEMSRFVAAHQSLNRVAMSTADLVAQAEEMTEGELANVFAAVDHMSGRVDVNSNGVVMLTAIHRNGSNPPQISWQRKSNATFSAASHIGSTVGSVPTLPPNVTVVPGGGLIVAEVFYEYDPIMYDRVISDREIYHRAFYRPRFGALTTVQPDPPS